VTVKIDFQKPAHVEEAKLEPSDTLVPPAPEPPKIARTLRGSREFYGFEQGSWELRVTPAGIVANVTARGPTGNAVREIVLDTEQYGLVREVLQDLYNTAIDSA